jgi:hypothetical protein
MFSSSTLNYSTTNVLNYMSTEVHAGVAGNRQCHQKDYAENYRRSFVIARP